jgi:hypothetical protein
MKLLCIPKLPKRKEHVVYVDGGRVMATMNI